MRMRAPSLNDRTCWRHDGVFGTGPCGRPSTVIPHEPQTPSRQSESNATGSRPSTTSASLSRSSNSSSDISGVASSTTYSS